MYAYVKAVCLSRSIGSQWQELDVSNYLVYDIFNKFTKVYLELSNIVLTQNVYVDLDILKAEYSSYNDTLNDLLIELDDRTLQTVTQLPSTVVKYAKYSDIFRSEYKAKITEAGIVHPDNYPESELHDIELTRPKYGTDMSLIHSHCLVSVNGYVHMTDTDGSKAYVYHAANTMRKSRLNHMGILSFLDIGELTKVSLNKNNIVGQSDTSPLRERIYFHIDENIDNKAVILVLGGYLVFPSEGVFWQSGNRTFALDLNQLQYIERIYESDMYIDLSQLALTTDAINEDMINVDELWSDRVIKEYMTLSQSFLVIVDTQQLTTNKIYLRHSSMPGMFTAYRDPVYPMVANYGKIVEYWKTYEDGHWAVNVQDSFLRNYIFTTQRKQQLANVTNNMISSKPFWHSRGYLLEIAGYDI
jgi:hypothetical protein